MPVVSALHLAMPEDVRGIQDAVIDLKENYILEDSRQK